MLCLNADTNALSTDLIDIVHRVVVLDLQEVVDVLVGKESGREAVFLGQRARACVCVFRQVKVCLHADVHAFIYLVPTHAISMRGFGCLCVCVCVADS